jgi:hypothetical protein
MSKFVVIEMQNGIIGGNTWVYDNRPDAEVKLYQVLAEVVKSPVEVHTAMLITDEGFVLDAKCYKHEIAPEPEPEPEPTPEPEPEGDTEYIPE